MSSDLNLTLNACAKALSSAAGPGLQQECRGKGNLNVGDMCVTKGYSLKCRNVFHVVAANWPDAICDLQVAAGRPVVLDYLLTAPK